MSEVPMAVRIGFAAGAILLVVAYRLHVARRPNAAAVALLAALAAALGPGLAGAGRAPSSAQPAEKLPNHYQVELLYQLQLGTLRHLLVEADMAKGEKRLSRYEATIYSQLGEDGILVEILRRIGVTNRHFVEFGSGNGSENSTVALLMAGWSGLWMDAHGPFLEEAKTKFAGLAASGRLRLQTAQVNAENIEELLRAAETPASFDVLSIDIDRNDYWVWKAITSFTPRLVIIEYNAIFPPGVDWVVNYEPESWWDNTSHFGASLTALERLGREKGYALVGCNLLGANAFFVRRELAENRFDEPFTAENHYQPPRYEMVWHKGGHWRRVAPAAVFEMPSPEARR